MKENKVSYLLKRFLAAQEAGKEVYFDVDEIEDVLDSLEDRGDYTYFEDILSLGLRLHPNSIDLRYRQCKLYIYNEQYNKALELIEGIGKSEDLDIELLRLECYCALNQYNKVVRYIEGLIDNNSDELEEVFEYLAPIISDLNTEEETSDFLQRGLSLFPDNLILKDELCLHLESTGDIEGAIGICNELIDKNPYSVDYWFMLGRLYSMSADYEKAIEAFDFALTCDDSDTELKILKAYCLYMNENYERAIDVYSDILSAGDNELAARIKPLMAESYIKLDKYEEAYQILRNEMQHKGFNQENDVSAFLNLIRCCMETDRENEATDILKTALEQYPDNIRLLSIQAIKYIDEGKEEEANEITEKLFHLIDEADDNYIGNAESLFQTAQFLSLKNDTKEALRYYLKILNIDPQMPHINMYIAMTYLSIGDIDSFNEYYNKTSPDNIVEFLNNSGMNMENMQYDPDYNHIQPEDLAKEFLRNKRYRN